MSDSPSTGFWFEVTAPDPSNEMPYYLGAGQSKEVRVLFEPYSTGYRETVIDLGNGACANVSCRGNGT